MKNAALVLMHAKQVILIIVVKYMLCWTKIDTYKKWQSVSERIKTWNKQWDKQINELFEKKVRRNSHRAGTMYKWIEGRVSPQCNQITQTYVIFTRISFISQPGWKLLRYFFYILQALIYFIVIMASPLYLCTTPAISLSLSLCEGTNSKRNHSHCSLVRSMGGH